MNEEIFNLELRKFLKQFGITAQREVERVVRASLQSGRLAGTETLRARARLELDGLGTAAVVEGTIALA